MSQSVHSGATAVSRRRLLGLIPAVTAAVLPWSAAVYGQGGKTPHWVMLIDVRRCIGCEACTVACAHEHNLPRGVYRTHVSTYAVEDPAAGHAAVVQLPRLCNHCDVPACVEVCAFGATRKLDNGTVVIDQNRCVGCGACVTICPSDARFIDPVTHKAQKCTYCINRIEAGLLPACVETCVGSARIFGDLNDPQSPVCRAMDAAKAEGAVLSVLKPEEGTKPQVFYIGLAEESLTEANTTSVRTK